MNGRISLLAVGHASSLFLATTFTLCVAFDLALPEMAMFETWRKLLPGFEWLSWPSFLLGLVESYGYGWYFTLIWVPLHNFVAARQAKIVGSQGGRWHDGATGAGVDRDSQTDK